MKLIVFVILIAHFLANILYAVTLTDPDPDNWMVHAGIQDLPPADIYLNSLYWAITVMVTVGYGDLVPRTRREKLIHVATMIISSVMFGYILSSIGSLIVEISNYSSEAR